jgi:hypothetical protein
VHARWRRTCCASGIRPGRIAVIRAPPDDSGVGAALQRESAAHSRPSSWQGCAAWALACAHLRMARPSCCSESVGAVIGRWPARTLLTVSCSTTWRTSWRGRADDALPCWSGHRPTACRQSPSRRCCSASSPTGTRDDGFACVAARQRPLRARHLGAAWWQTLHRSALLAIQAVVLIALSARLAGARARRLAADG